MGSFVIEVKPILEIVRVLVELSHIIAVYIWYIMFLTD